MRTQVRVRLCSGAVPLLEGALACSAAGVASSLLPQNMRTAAGAVANPLHVGGDRPPADGGTPGLWPLLCDPQTAGGLLAGCGLSSRVFQGFLGCEASGRCCASADRQRPTRGVWAVI